MKKLAMLIVVFSMALVLPLTALGQDGGEESELNTFYDGNFFLIMPDGWVAEAEDESIFSFGTSQEAIDQLSVDEAEFGEGEVAVTMFVFDFATLEQIGIDVEGDNIEEDLINFFLAADSDLAINEISDVENTVVGGRPVSSVEVDIETFDVTYLSAEVAPDYYALVGIGYDNDAGDTMLPEALGVVQNSYYSPSLDEEYSDDAVSFNYPANWVIDESSASGGFYLVANNQEAIAADDISEDLYGMVLIDGTASLTGQDPAEATGVLAENFANEGDEISDTFLLEFDGRDVYIVTLSNEDEDSPEGLVLLTETENGSLVAGYALSSQDQSGLQLLIAVNVLLSMEVGE